MNMPIYYDGTAIFIPTWLAAIAAIYLVIEGVRAIVGIVSAIRVMLNSEFVAHKLDEAWRDEEKK